MPKIQYKEINIRKAGLDLITQVNTVISDYKEQGYSLTLRQIYYQLVSKNMLENSERSYNNLGVLLNNGRLGGLVDWEAIEDRTRYIRALSHWNHPGEIIKDAAASYNIDLWQGQDYYIEVWVEKDALIGIVEQTATRYDVPCFSCRGYVSQSEMWEAAQRIIEKNRTDKKCIVLHLGDHDPSGIDMTRDIRERLYMFGAAVEIKRLALNMPQIEQYNPPPNPAKVTDTRAGSYIKQYGISSWELDALEPHILDELISKNILQYLDHDKFSQAQIRQTEERNQILNIHFMY